MKKLEIEIFYFQTLKVNGKILLQWCVCGVGGRNLFSDTNFSVKFTSSILVTKKYLQGILSIFRMKMFKIFN